MAKQIAQRYSNNKKCMLIASKPISEITEEEKDLLRKEYTGYGSLLPKNEGFAQYFTPRLLCKFLAELLEPRIPKHGKILEPSIGTGNLISYFGEDKQITGMDIDEMNVKISRILYPNADIKHLNAMEYLEEDKYDLVIGNPPFNINITSQKEWKMSRLDKKTNLYKGNSDLLFLEQAIKSCKIGGYIAFILPNSINYKESLRKIEEYISKTCWVLYNIELPPETFFLSGTNIKTTLLVLRKAPKNLPKVKSTNYNETKKEYLLGQPSITCIKITDIGYDNKGNVTCYEDEEGLYTQLDMISEDLKNDLMSDNLPPETNESNKFYFAIDENNKAYLFEKFKEKKSEYPIWNILTLGRGREIEYEGVKYETHYRHTMKQLLEKYNK